MTLRFQRHAHLRAPFLLLAGWQMADIRWALSIRQGGLPWDTPLGLVLTVIEATAMLMLLTGVLSALGRSRSKAYQPLSAE